MGALFYCCEALLLSLSHSVAFANTYKCSNILGEPEEGWTEGRVVTLLSSVGKFARAS